MPSFKLRYFRFIVLTWVADKMPRDKMSPDKMRTKRHRRECRCGLLPHDSLSGTVSERQKISSNFIFN